MGLKNETQKLCLLNSNFIIPLFGMGSLNLTYLLGAIKNPLGLEAYSVWELRRQSLLTLKRAVIKFVQN